MGIIAFVGDLKLMEALCPVKVTLLNSFEKITLYGPDAKVRLEAGEAHVNLHSKIGGLNKVTTLYLT